MRSTDANPNVGTDVAASVCYGPRRGAVRVHVAHGADAAQEQRTHGGMLLSPHCMVWAGLTQGRSRSSHVG